MSGVDIPVTPTLTRNDGTALALADLSAINGYVAVKPTDPAVKPVFAKLGSLTPAAVVHFLIPNDTPGDYLFYATDTDNQVPPREGDPSPQAAFTVPVPVVVLAPPSAPAVGAITITP